MKIKIVLIAKYFDIINKLNEAYLPLLQFNLEVNSFDEAKKAIERSKGLSK